MKAYALTDIGKTRKVNQDAQFASSRWENFPTCLSWRTEWAVIRREILLRAI